MPAKQPKSIRNPEPPGGLRTRAEEMLLTGPADLSAMPVEDIQALVHELQVHQMELEIQNEELRRAQIELAESHDRFSDLYEFAPVGFLTMKPNGRIAETNLAVAGMLGVNRKDLLGTAIEDFVAPDSQDALFLHKAEVFSAEKKCSCELEMRRKDGTELKVRLESIADGTAPDRRCRSALIDITEMRRTEEALDGLNLQLRREHDFTERLIETAPSMILVLDPESRVLRFNPAFERLSGWNLPEAMGLDWIETFHPEPNWESVRKIFEMAITGVRIQGSVSPILTKNGEVRQIEWYDAPLTGEEGELIGLLWTGNDVTERFHFEREVYKASEEEKKRIAVDLHDSLGSRLTGIGYRASGLSRKLRASMPAEADEADIILEQIRDAIVAVRTLSRGLQPVKDEPEALTAALKDLAEWVQTSSKLTCRFITPGGEVPLANPITANHLYRFAQEAATNAMRHSGATDLTILLKRDSEHILLSVRDNGSGFDRAKAARGNGMGLHIMEYRARAIGAELTIRPDDGGGTVVECAVAEG